MRTAGIIGGIGPESTIEYYRLIVASCRQRVSDGGYPPILINSIDLKRMLDLVEANRMADLTEYLLGEVVKLARAGANFALLAANTPHIVFEALRGRSPIPMISIVDVTCEAVKAFRLKRVGLFGTRFTMQAPFYPEGLALAGARLVLPSVEEQDYIHDKYLGELVKGIIRSETREALLAIVARLRAQERIDGLILGGTELPLILREADAGSLPFLDTTRLHVERVVAEMLA